MYPEDYYYTKDHEWIQVEGDVGTVGITDYAQKELGDVVFVELPEAGKTLEAGDVLGNIESVKAVSEIFAPVTGEVIEINESLADDPAMVNEDPHGEAWLVKLRIANPDELESLMSAGAYEKYVEEEAKD